MKYVQALSVALLLSCASNVQAITMSQEEAIISAQMGVIASQMIELKCFNTLLTSDEHRACDNLEMQHSALADSLHKAIDARKKAIEEILKVSAEETKPVDVKDLVTQLQYSSTFVEASEVKDAVSVVVNVVADDSKVLTEASEVHDSTSSLEFAHSTSADLA